MGKRTKSPQRQRSDIPYAERLKMQKMAATMAQRDDATQTALQLACIALNDTEGMGYVRLSRFAQHASELIREYYEDREVGDAHKDKRLKDLGFIVKDGHMYSLTNMSTGKLMSTRNYQDHPEKDAENYDPKSLEWMAKHPTEPVDVERCPICQYFYIPELGHKCKKRRK